MMKNVYAEKKSSAFDVSDVLAITWRRKWLIVLPLILVTVVTLAGSYLITPEYESSVIVFIGNTMKLSTELQRLLGDGGRGYQTDRDRRLSLRSMQNEIKSSPFIRQLVERLELNKNPGLEKTALKMQAANPGIPLEQIKFDILLGGLREDIDIAYAGRDQIIITTQSTDPVVARDMAETLGEIFIAEKLKQELGSVRLSQDFSYEQLSKYERDLQNKIDERTRIEKELMAMQLDESIVSDDNRKMIISEIEATKVDIDDRKEEERNLLNQLSDISARELVLRESDGLTRLKRDIKNHMNSVANLMQQHSWSDPEILNYKARLFALQDEIEDETKDLVDEQFSSLDADKRKQLTRLFNVRAEMDILYTRSNQLQLALDDLDRKINRVPDYQARLEQVTREVAAARDLRDKFQEQQESSEISQALLRESKFNIVEPAKLPLSPFKPQRKKIVVLGFLLGLAIGVGAALLAEVLDKSFRRVDEIEKTVGLPVIGVIPQIESLKKMKVN